MARAVSTALALVETELLSGRLSNAAGQGGLVVLTREALGGQRAERPAPVAAEGVVVAGGLGRPCTVDDGRRAVQLVAQQVIDRPSAAHGDNAARTRVVALARAAGILVDAPNVNGRHPAHGSLHSVAVGVIDEAGADAASTHADQSILEIVSQGVDHSADGAAGLVAVGVVGSIFA